MVTSMKKRYDEFKKYGNILLDYDEILLFFPDYYKTKVVLENTKFVMAEEADKYFEENYRDSALYKKLTTLAMADDEIYAFMKHNKDIKYNNVKLIFEKLVEFSISLCDLIDYIGHYPSTWPVPKEDEKNPEMEELLEKFDIIVRYHLDDELDKMQISSEDVVRIIDTLKSRLISIENIKNKDLIGEWLLTRKVSDEFHNNETVRLIEEVEKFPLSSYQMQGKSKREEGKKYLRLQHGENII